MNSIIYTKCPFCQASAKSLWPEVKVCKCSSCNLLFRYPASSLEELEILYKTSWNDPTDQIEETGATSPDLAQAYVNELAKSLGRKDLKGLRILDYGAGRGAILKALLDAGADAYGVEPFGCEFLRESSYKAFKSVDELPKDILFDGITSLDVVEHVQVPWYDFNKLKDYLVENGWLYITTPNAAGINAQYYHSNWREIKNRGHLFFFTPATLANVLKKCGYNNIQRLHWFINYRRGVLATVMHWLFQLTHIDGELRFLAFK